MITHEGADTMWLNAIPLSFRVQRATKGNIVMRIRKMRRQNSLDEPVLDKSGKFVDGKPKLLGAQSVVRISWGNWLAIIRNTMSSPVSDLAKDVPLPFRQRLNCQSFLQQSL